MSDFSCLGDSIGEATFDEFLIDYELIAALDLESFDWDIRFYTLAADTAKTIALDAFVPAVQHIRPADVPQVPLWNTDIDHPRRGGGGGRRGGRGRGRGGGRAHRGGRGRGGPGRGGRRGRARGAGDAEPPPESDPEEPHEDGADDNEELEEPLVPLEDEGPDEAEKPDLEPDDPDPDVVLVPDEILAYQVALFAISISLDSSIYFNGTKCTAYGPCEV